MIKSKDYMLIIRRGSIFYKPLECNGGQWVALTAISQEIPNIRKLFIFL